VQPIGLAYLLARTTDTIADTEIIPLAQRLAALHQLRERILGQSVMPLPFSELARQQGAPAERLLLERVEESLAMLATLSAADAKLVREVLITITSGQELDLQRFGRLAEVPGEPASRAGADACPAQQKIIALETPAELDDYTYRVAGCVGEFWTKICRAHLFPKAHLDDKQFIADGIRFGKGLQLVNILRDLPVDLKNGRCYLPRQQLAAAKLHPESLLSPAMEGTFLPLFRQHLDQAEAHLTAGWRYTNTLPFGQFRVRLACAWPILLGARTLEKLRAADGAALKQRVKVSRREVRQIIFRSLLASPFAPTWQKLHGLPANAIASARELA
jgi:farnesyl-diphosphate farnesyltransferase